MAQRLDIYDRFPPGMKEYLSYYGWHFSKRMARFAISGMKVADGVADKVNRLVPWSKSEVDDMLRRNGITIDHDVLYDVWYVANMLKADFYKKSLSDEAHLCVHIKLYLDDADGDPCRAFDEFYATCIGKGVPIPWDDMLDDAGETSEV